MDGLQNSVIRKREYFFLALSGVVFILTASSWTSPLFPGSYGYDASFFSLVGRGILEGRVPYRDFFDIKGPVFFFIEALGQLLCRDRFGVVLLQSASITAAVILLYQLCLLYLTKKQAVCVLAVFYFVYITCLWGGNSVEEMCLPFNMACIYLGVKYLKERTWDKIESPAFFFGLSFGIMALSKVTVAAPMIAVTLTVLLFLAREGQGKKILKCAFFFLGGTAMVAFPVFVYYGTRGALNEMLFCAFRIAFKRSTDYYEGFSLKWESYLLICYASFLYTFLKRKEEGFEKWFMGILAVVTFLLLHLGTPFDYYFITTLPLIAWVCIAFFCDLNLYVSERARKEKAAVSGTCAENPGGESIKRPLFKILFAESAIVMVLCSYGDDTIGKIRDNIEIARNKTEMEYYNACQEIFELIPESERENIYCLESGMIFYEVNQILPANEYPVNLPYFMELNPPIKDIILNRIENETPKWLISENIGDFDDDDVKIAVYKNYELVAQNSAEQLYRRIER